MTEHRLVAVQAGEEALAGTGHHRLTDQALFVEAVTQALLRRIRVVAEVTEHIVGAEELLEVGQLRIGFNQVFMAGGGKHAAGQALHACNLQRCSVYGRTTGVVARTWTALQVPPTASGRSRPLGSLASADRHCATDQGAVARSTLRRAGRAVCAALPA